MELGVDSTQPVRLEDGRYGYDVIIVGGQNERRIVTVPFHHKSVGDIIPNIRISNEHEDFLWLQFLNGADYPVEAGSAILVGRMASNRSIGMVLPSETTPEELRVLQARYTLAREQLGFEDVILTDTSQELLTTCLNTRAALPTSFI